MCSTASFGSAPVKPLSFSPSPVKQGAFMEGNSVPAKSNAVFCVAALLTCCLKVANHPHFATVNTALGSTTFGCATTANDARILKGMLRVSV